MKRPPEARARFKRAARSEPPFRIALSDSSSLHAALNADTVSLRARSGGSRRAKSAPSQGVPAGSRFRSTESPLSESCHSD